MSISNITATVVNGVQEITTGNDISTTGGATDEAILMYGSNANVRAIGTGDVTFTRCNFYILNDVTAIANPSQSVLSYNGDNSDRTDNNSFMRLIDTQLIFDASGRKNLFFSELTRSKIIHQDSSNALYIYTPPDAILQDLLFNGTQTWEVVGVPSVASGIKLQDVTYGFLNWQAGRLDFLYIEVQSNTADAWLGNGNGGNNQAYMWNSVAFDNTKIRLQNANGTLYEGNTASWRFIDQATDANVDDVLVIYDSDLSGSRAELGRFTTNSNGLLQGTYDSQNNTTGSDIERPTLFVLNSYTDQAGTTHSAGGGNSYDNQAVTAYIEIRAYLYEQPSGYSVNDSLNLASPAGQLSPNYSVSEYELFRLKPDANLTQTNKTTVLAYTTLDTPETLYDRAKAEWRDNDNFPLISRSGSLINLGAYDIDIDATAAAAYSFSGNKITIKSANFVGDMITTGIIALLNGAIFTGTRTDANGTVAPPNTATITGITAGSRLRVYNETTAAEVVNQIVTGTSYVAQYIEGTGYSSGDVINVRLTYQNGTSAKLGFQVNASVTSVGWSVLADQKDDESYNSIGLDGSTITKFSADFVNDEVDIVSVSNFTGHELYARFVYFTFTEDGIRDFFGALIARDLANIENDVTILDMYINNNTSTNLIQTDNVRIFKSNGTYPVRNPTTGGGGVDVVWRDKVFLAETGTSGLTPSESAKLFGLPTAAQNADAVWDEPLTGATHNDPTSAGRRLRQASAWLSAEGEVGSSPSLSSVATNLTKNEDDFYNDHTFVFLSGPQQGQARIIEDYDGTTKTITFDEDLTSLPTAGDEFAILANHEHTITQIKNGVLQGDIESGYSLEESIRLQNAILLGKASQAPNGTIFRDIADTKDRVISKTDDDGNRKEITLDET